MRSDIGRSSSLSPSSIDLTIYHFSLWRLSSHCCFYFLDWTELFGTPSQSHLAMDAPQLRVQLASAEILLDQWLTWEFYVLCDKQAAASPPPLLSPTGNKKPSQSIRCDARRRLHDTECWWNLCWLNLLSHIKLTAPNNSNFILFCESRVRLFVTLCVCFYCLLRRHTHESMRRALARTSNTACKDGNRYAVRIGSIREKKNN